MPKAMEMFGEWQKSIGVKPIVWLKCLAHLILGFESEADKLLSDLEHKFDALKHVANPTTSSFFESSNSSAYWTMAYAIYRFLGESDDSVSYSLTSEFRTFLESNELKQILFDIKQARFGEFFLVGAHISYLIPHITTFLGNYMKDNQLY